MTSPKYISAHMGVPQTPLSRLDLHSNSWPFEHAQNTARAKGARNLCKGARKWFRCGPAMSNSFLAMLAAKQDLLLCLWRHEYFVDRA